MKVICDLSVSAAGHRRRESWSPGHLFRNGEKGVWFDPSDLACLFLSAAGEEVVGQSGTPVGRMQGKSGGALHATQTGFARPTYCVTAASGHRNLVSVSEPRFADLSNGSGVMDAAIAMPGFVTSIEVPGGISGTRNAYLADSIAPETEHTLSCFLAMDDGGAPVPGADFSIAIGNVAAGGGWGVPVEIGQGIWRVSRTLTSSVGNLQNTGVLKTADHSSRGFRVSGFQVERASVMTPYQHARSAFDLREAGVPTLSALDFDGVDDCLLTGTLDLGYTDQVTVIAGIVKHSNPSMRGTVVNFSDNGYRSFGLEVPMPGSSETRWLHAGASSLRAIKHGYDVDARAVMTGLSDLAAPLLAFRQNGVLIQIDRSATGGGPFKSGALGIGDYVSPTGRRLHGRLFGLIVIDRLLTSQELARVETWMSMKTGVPL
ncbi:hypothetical protein [uncultured Shimia sp.]|uniref:phage head spike fiber domain-containing protein n=1 Tax=uncultured Shimia sp. TaxID=573152 RepID=UPI00260BE46D|nr:hypothetical protein [uncultured Shimia sp.]